MEKRIINLDDLAAHGNIAGRKAMLQILETGMEAANPYYNTKELIHIEGNKLIVGKKKFEPKGDPQSGEEVIDLNTIKNIYVLGAGKGIQHVAKAIEEVLGERLTGGHVIDKNEHPVILGKIGVSLGGHPVPDEGCVGGCKKILEYTKKLTKDDLVFTCISNGVSATLTMPVPGVTLDDVKETTYIMQIKHGAPTTDLNHIRNNLDMMKGGRITRYIQPARAIHIFSIRSYSYDHLMHHNLWLHTMPDCTTFEQAMKNLKKWDAWDEVPQSVRDFLTKADPSYATVTAEEFLKTRHRIFGVMPDFRDCSAEQPALKKAAELGFKPVVLSDKMFHVEAREAGTYVSRLCESIESNGCPFEPPVAMFSFGEMTVAVGNEQGIGGRSQEFALSAALTLAGTENIVIASVDTDGTDGPGTQFHKGEGDMPSCLAGGIVDGQTADEAIKAGVDIWGELKKHNTSPALWKLKSGIAATPNISVGDFTVALVTGRSKKENFLG